MDLFCKRGCFCLPVAAIQALRSVLNAFCVVNRKNMFVYQERSTKSVFYLRFDSLLLLFFSSGSSFVPKVFFSISPPMLKESSQYKLPSINFPLYCESFVKIVVTRLSLTFFHLVCWKQKSTHRCSYNNSVVEEKSDFLVIELLSNRTSQGNNFVMFVPDGGASKSQCSLWGWSQRFLSCLLTQFPVHFTVKHSQLTYCVVFN